MFGCVALGGRWVFGFFVVRFCGFFFFNYERLCCESQIHRGCSPTRQLGDGGWEKRCWHPCTHTALWEESGEKTTVSSLWRLGGFCCTKHFHCPISTKSRERGSSWKHWKQSKMAGQELNGKKSNFKPLWRSQEDQHLKTCSSQLSICWGWECTRAWEEVPHHLPHQQQPGKLFVTE